MPDYELADRGSPARPASRPSTPSAGAPAPASSSPKRVGRHSRDAPLRPKTPLGGGRLFLLPARSLSVLGFRLWGFMPIWGRDPIFQMSNRGTLIGQTILVNVFLVTAVLFGATSAANLNLRIQGERVQFALLALSIMLALLANIMMLRRRFSPLEELIDRLEAIDPAHADSFEDRRRPGEWRRWTACRPPSGGCSSAWRASAAAAAGSCCAPRRRSASALARDLHDEVNQALTAILLRLQALMQDSPSPEVAAELARAQAAREPGDGGAAPARPAAAPDRARRPRPACRRSRARCGASATSTGSRPRLETRASAELARRRPAAGGLPRGPGGARQRGAPRAARRAWRWTSRPATSGSSCASATTARGFDRRTAPPPASASNGMAERARLVGGELTSTPRPAAAPP